MPANPGRTTSPKLRLVSSNQALPDFGQPGPSGRAVDDSELLAALRQGDATAAAVFHDRVRPQVDRTLGRLLGRRDADHEDMAQLAMIELIYTIDRYRGDCSLDSWTSTLTAHVVYKHIRRRQTERRLFRGLADDDLPAVSHHRTGREAMARSAVARVVQHLDGLEPTRAWTFVLHDVLGYDLREIAQITGVSVAAAQTRLVRGRREVHQRIADDPELINVLEEMEGSR
jgi:RNA polymerase sigma-70 factor (ECF subfamily)